MVTGEVFPVLVELTWNDPIYILLITEIKLTHSLQFYIGIIRAKPQIHICDAGNEKGPAVGIENFQYKQKKDD